MKEFLEEKGVDLSRLKLKVPNRAARRRLKTMPGGEITVPVPPSTEAVREAIKVNT